MVRINLLKKNTKVRRPVIERPQRVWPVKGIVIGSLTVCATVILFFGVKFLLPAVSEHPEKQYQVEEKLKPSTHSEASAVIEDVVQEQDESGELLRQNGVLELPYEQLSMAEKINYEILFAKNLCEILSVTVPSGIGFRTLSAKGFNRIEGVTFTSSRELITGMLTSFKERRIEPLPKPSSVIRKMEAGYQFAFVAEVRSGLNLREQFIDMELGHLAVRDNLPFMMKKLEYVARNSSLTMSGKPQKLSEQAEGRFLKARYVIKGDVSYENFVRFVNGLHEERIPCAFEEFKLSAKSREVCSFEANLLFTMPN
jgi:hypothetical protein